MTRRPPLPLPARVARDVMGREVCSDPDCDGCEAPVYLGREGWRAVKQSALGSHEFDPEGNAGDLLDVIEALHGRGLYVRIDSDERSTYVEITDIQGDLMGCHELSPRGRHTWRQCFARAVCRAALEAVKS